jgi:hypothetical protein
LLFIKEAQAAKILRTSIVGPPRNKWDVEGPINHNKFMIITDALIDGKLTDIMLTGTTNISWWQMVKEVNSAVTLDNKQTISSYRAYHSYIWNCSSMEGIFFMQSIGTNNSEYSML